MRDRLHDPFPFPPAPAASPARRRRLTQPQIDRLFKGPFTERQGRFNYIEWAKVLRVNDGEMEKDNALEL